MFFRTPYNYDPDLVSEETALTCPEPGRTQQHQKEEADINVIVKRFGLTGELPSGLRVPQYGDFTAVTDYQTALNMVRAAEEAFMELPAEIRKRFNHDPDELIAFVADEQNRSEAEKLGIVVPRQVVAETAQTTAETAS